MPAFIVNERTVAAFGLLDGASEESAGQLIESFTGIDSDEKPITEFLTNVHHITEQAGDYIGLKSESEVTIKPLKVSQL